jgi:hypothetical protein
MGVFSERIFGMFLAMPWRSRSASSAPKTEALAVARDESKPAPTWQTGRDQSPSTSVMRADLEALRAFSRVR